MATPFIDWPADAVYAEVFRHITPAALLDTVRREFDADPSWCDCQVLEALYDPGRQLRLAFAIGPQGLQAERAWPEGEVFYLRHPVREPMSRRGRVVGLGADACELYRFPNDRRLRGLRHFAGRQEAARVWQRWLDDAGDALQLDEQSLRRSLLRYVPEQKWIIRLLGRALDASKGEQCKVAVAVRACDPLDGSALHARLQALRQAGPRSQQAFRVPKPIAFDNELGLTAIRWVWGDDLLDLLKKADEDAVLQQIAGGLHALHATELPDLECATPGTYLVRASHAASDIAAVCPRLDRRVQELVTDLQRQRPELAPSATVHNDFHFKQIRGRADKLTLLDFERCARGDGLADVATFAAQLEALGSRGELQVPKDSARRWCTRFLSAWEDVAGEPVDLARLNWYAACALLTLARGQLRHLRPGWPAVVEHCVDKAASVMSHDSAELCA